MHSHMFHPVHKVLKANNIFSGSRQAIVHKLKVFNTAVTRTAVLPDGAALCAEDVVSVVNLVLGTGHFNWTSDWKEEREKKERAPDPLVNYRLSASIEELLMFSD